MSLTAHEWIELIADRAADLRAAGVVQLELEGCKLTLAPPATTSDAAAAGEDDGRAPLFVDDGDPLNDPATFAGGRLPRFPRRDEAL